MGDSPEPKVVVKKAYKCGEDEATLPNRFGKKANTVNLVLQTRSSARV